MTLPAGAIGADRVGTVVLTALDLKLSELHAFLTDNETECRRGTVAGTVRGTAARIALAATGTGNGAAAWHVELITQVFRPRSALYVGIACALHDDLALGDVVVATRNYAYQSRRLPARAEGVGDAIFAVAAGPAPDPDAVLGVAATRPVRPAVPGRVPAGRRTRPTSSTACLTAPIQIEAARAMAKAKGGDVSGISPADLGEFYVAAHGSMPVKVLTPPCLSHHPRNPLTTEEVIERTRH